MHATSLAQSDRRRGTFSLSGMFLLVLVFSSTSLSAISLQNGDFSRGKALWLGAGSLVYRKTDGTTEAAPDQAVDGVPLTTTAPPDETLMWEIPLSPSQFRSISQTFNLSSPTDHIDVTIIGCASADFKALDHFRLYSPRHEWNSETPTIIDRIDYPKADLFLRFDEVNYGSYIFDFRTYFNTRYSYSTATLGPDLQTIKMSFKVANPKIPLVINIFVPPGEGSVFIKSVTID